MAPRIPDLPLPTSGEVGSYRPARLPCVLEATVGGAMRSHRLMLGTKLKHSFPLRPWASLPRLSYFHRRECQDQLK
jgi:hypothetical protein